MEHTHRRRFSSFAGLAALFSMLAACASTGSGGAAGPGLVGRVVAASDALSKPALFVSYDGDTLIAWSKGAARAEIFWRDSNPRTYAYPPRDVSAGKAIVRSRSLDLDWDGGFDDPLPFQVQRFFSVEEIAAWGLVFAGGDAVSP